MWPKAALLIACAMVLAGCKKESDDRARDHFSFANSAQFLTHHLELDLTADFDREQLSGTAVLHMERLEPGAGEVILDSRDLAVEEALVSLPAGEWMAAAFRTGESDPMKGAPLIITLPPDFQPDPHFRVRIGYHTSPDASALMWLPPELTAGGKHPFMFTQSQSIHARSWVPLQDTPSVRITYEAIIRTPPELLALMSAENDPLAKRNGEYRFEMPQPIPSYLLALAVGNIFFEPIGKDSGVYAEPEILQAAAWEFADTQDMLDTAADIYGPYQWGRYDLLILPPSFPFGGMENPRLSFITPSLIAGDRSLVSTIAHELAHSWSGDEERVLAYEELMLDFEHVIPTMQALAPDFETGDPDESQGTVHYHKGELFLTELERVFGREVFDAFLAAYFKHFEFQAITSAQFLDYLDRELLQAHAGKFSRARAEAWLYQPGLPDDTLIPESTALDQARQAATDWLQGELGMEDLPVNDWSPQAAVHFINSLPPELDKGRLAELDKALGFSESKNAEIGRTWFIQVAMRRYEPAYVQMEQYLNRYGRTRLVAPIYRALVENGKDAALAQELFAAARAGYHPLTQTKILAFLPPSEK
jgi:hypothetical protein